MTLATDELRPFQALLVAQVEDQGEETAAAVIGRLREVLRLRSRGDRRVVDNGASENPDAAIVHYQDQRQVAWALNDVRDRVNHLAAVIVRGRWVAIHCTETSRRDTIRRALAKGDLGTLKPVRSGHLKAAFMKGPARTLWMRGTHRSTPYKADSKVLGGSDLAPALDPLGDQSYRYTAARCDPDDSEIGAVMGLAVEQSRVWVGPSRSWEDFEHVVLALFDALELTAGQSLEPLPVLAESQADLAEVEGAYDVAISQPEMLSLGPVQNQAQADHLADLEKLAFATQFEVEAGAGSDLRARVLRRGEPIGELAISFSADRERVEIEASGGAAKGREAELVEVLETVSDPEAVSVYYESGHTIQSGRVFTVRHRDIPYLSWSWGDFGRYWEIEHEKPDKVDVYAIGKHRSLFDWMLAEWPTELFPTETRGWLACDDRPGETADFIHLDESGSVPKLTLIHVKAAKSDSPKREIAVVPYETVAAQAIKNLRHLDARLAREELISGTLPKGIELATWYQGARRSRREFTDRLDELGSNFSRRVAIVQPHVRKTLIDEIRADPGHRQAARLRQLDTLLHGVAANCQSAGADFVVVGDKTRPPKKRAAR